MKEPLKIKKRGEDGNKVITVRIKERLIFQCFKVEQKKKKPCN